MADPQVMLCRMVGWKARFMHYWRDEGDWRLFRGRLDLEIMVLTLVWSKLMPWCLLGLVGLRGCVAAWLRGCLLAFRGWGWGPSANGGRARVAAPGVSVNLQPSCLRARNNHDVDRD